MAKKEKFGKFVLLDEMESSALGTEYRAAKLSSTGLEKVVTVLRLKPTLSASADAVKGLMDQVKVAAQLQNPNIIKIYGIGKVDSSYYISYEFLEAKSLRAIFNRCRQEGFPFSVDHALLIASKICTALEHAHGRKTDAGGRYFHGALNPSSVLVSYEGEVRIRGFGYWPGRIKEMGGLGDDDSLYLAPEQASGGAGDTRSDVFSVGAILFEALTGEALFHGGRQDLAARLAKARLQNPTGEDDSLPKPIAEILSRSLAADPAGRYAEIQEMRKAVDTLLFSGDFTPTTFNLAFFMHSLFRDDIERESKALKEERDATYIEYLTEDAKPAAAAASAARIPEPPTPMPATMAMPSPLPPEAAAPHVARDEHPAPPPRREIPPPPPHVEPPGLTSRDAASGFTFHKEDGKKSKLPLIGGLAAVLLIAAVAAFMLRGRGGAPGAPAPEGAAPPTSTLTAEAIAMAKVKELEEKLQAIEAEKAAAIAKAEEDERKKLEAQAKAKGQVVDPAALARAAEEARKKAQAEQDRKAQEEKLRLEEEQKAAEARLAEERRKAEEEAARVAAATPTTLAAPPTTVAPAVRPGALVDLSDAGVIAPVVVSKPPLLYPPLAQSRRIAGTVGLSALVDENGKVAEAKVVAPAGGRAGLEEAAVDNVKKWRFRPATKDGVAVKVWFSVNVVFKLPG